MNKLVLGNKNYSSWSMRPWLALKKANIEFDEIVIALYQHDSKSKLMQYTPCGKVPVLITDNFTVWDSLSICEYAAELNPLLWPQGQGERALARSISNEMHSGFNRIRDAMPMNSRAVNRQIPITDDIKIEVQRIETIWTNCINAGKYDQPWLFGQFSIADAMYAPIVSRFHTYGITLNNQCSQYMQMVLNDEHVKQWFDAGARETEVIESAEVGNI